MWFVLILLAFLAPSLAPAQIPVQFSPPRDQWFYSQRAYPNGIPEDGLNKALMQRRNLERSIQLFSAPVEGEPGAAWQLIGPWAVRNPNELNASGRVTAIAVDPRNPDYVYIGAAGGGVWRSKDGGASWKSAGDHLITLVSGSLALDQRNGILYFGSGDHGAGTYGAGVWSSDDEGLTWLSASGWDEARNKPQFSGGTTPRIALHPADPKILLVARSSGIWRSEDGAQSWYQVLAGVATDVLFDRGNGSVAYAAIGRNTGHADNGVYRSLDGGLHWTRLSGVPGGAAAGRISLAIGAWLPDAVGGPGGGPLYALLARASDQQLLGLFRSNDMGETWAQLPAPASLFDSDGRGHGYFDNFVAVDPGNPDAVWLGGVELHKSTDGGGSWRLLSLAPGGRRVIHEDQFSIAFKPGNSNTVYIGNDGGIYKTTDGGVTWISLNENLPITQLNSIAINPHNEGMILGGTQDQGLVRFIGDMVWDQPIRGDSRAVIFDPRNPSVVYAGKQLMRLFKSGDGGASFTQIGNGIDTADRVSFYPPLAMSADTSAVLYFGTYRVWRTTDGGSNWSAVSGDLTNGGLVTALSTAPGGVVYAGSSDGRLSVSTAAGWRSTDVINRWITSITPDPRDPKVAYLTVSGFGTGHVFRSGDQGASWSDISGNLPDAPANQVVVDSDGTLYLATDVGVFRSDDGSSWTSLNTGLPTAFVTGLSLDPATGLLAAATYGHSAWRISVRAGSTGPRIFAGGIVNAASYASMLAPGTLASVFGSRLAPGGAAPDGRPLPITLLGTSVSVNGIAAPLFFMSPGQINFQIPAEIRTSAALVTVTTEEGVTSAPILLWPTAPGILSGTVQHGDGSGPVTPERPAARGEVLVLFAVGLGATGPAVATGEAAPAGPLAQVLAPVSVRFGTTAGSVQFAGLAPGFTGLYQVNVQVPQGVSGEQPLSITAGGRTSNAVTVNIRP